MCKTMLLVFLQRGLCYCSEDVAAWYGAQISTPVFCNVAKLKCSFQKNYTDLFSCVFLWWHFMFKLTFHWCLNYCFIWNAFLFIVVPYEIQILMCKHLPCVVWKLIIIYYNKFLFLMILLQKCLLHPMHMPRNSPNHLNTFKGCLRCSCQL